MGPGGCSTYAPAGVLALTAPAGTPQISQRAPWRRLAQTSHTKEPNPVYRHKRSKVTQEKRELRRNTSYACCSHASLSSNDPQKLVFVFMPQKTNLCFIGIHFKSVFINPTDRFLLEIDFTFKKLLNKIPCVLCFVQQCTAMP